MKIKNNLKIIIPIVFVIFTISSFSLFIGTSSSSKINTDIRSFEGLQSSRVSSHPNKLWVENPTFETMENNPWFSTIDGDGSDVTTSTSPNQANIQIIGESYEKQVLLSNTTYSNWETFNKSDLVIVPNVNYGIDETGAYCAHDWNEDSGGQPYNTPRMHWKTIVNMSVDMSDYIITSASFQAIIYADVNQDIDTPGDDTARWPSSGLNQEVIYDHAQFYVEISDLGVNDLNTYEIAFNQTRLLGNEDLSYYEMEGLISAKSEQAIIDAINNVLAVDSGHDNFTIILGIYMYCEDNYSGNDRDQWEDLRFKSLNMTFSYVKKIDQSTAVSWNQELDAINGSNVRVTAANLNFKFKIDQNWTEASQNSHFRVYINDRKYTLPINLIDYVYSPDFQEARIGGYDITSKILPYEEFNLSIQVFLAEDFGLDHNISISITDVYLYISYTQTFADILSEPWIFTALLVVVSAAAVCLGGYFIAYQRILKYPRAVRKVRKYKRTLNRSTAPDVPIIPNGIAFKKVYNRELGESSKIFRLRTGESKASKVSGKFKIKK